MVDCLKCINSACCKLVIEVDKKEYKRFVKLGLKESFVTKTDEFLEKSPKYKSRKKQIDKMHEEDANYAELKKSEDGYCVFLGSDMLCSIYEERPEVCKKYQTSRCEGIRCIK